MARTPSNMLELGTALPSFSLPDTEGKLITHEQFRNSPLLVIFMCNHCPFVIHIRPKLAELTKKYLALGIPTVGINANDVANYPDDSPEKMKVEKKDAGYSFPYLFDEKQTVALAFRAACTPDIYLFDKNHCLVYRGQFDDSRPGNSIPVTGKDLERALQAMVNDETITFEQRPSLGCNIKWKAGNEP